jgi:DNA (cytosine-5)-methyltransferase 1
VKTCTRFLSVCSGIEAASAAWEPLGWKALAFAEIEPFPRAVLTHHYPDTPLHGDFTLLRDEPFIVDADVLVGGTPCQAFSIAGLRKSLDDDRGNLSLEFVRLANAIDDLRRAAGKRDAFICWENVPGVLSVADNAFGTFLGGLVGSESPIVPDGGWPSAGLVVGPRRTAAWRVLDAQFFGVPQRRRRVFVLARGHSRGWQCADALLSIGHSLSGHPAPRREAGQRVAPCLESGANSSGGTRPPGTTVDTAECLIPSTGETSHCLNAGGMGRQDYETETLIAHTLRGEGFDAGEGGTGRGTPLVPVAFVQNSRDEVRVFGDGNSVGALAAEPGAKQQCYIAFTAKDHGADAMEDCSPTLRAGGHSKSHANAGVMPAVAFQTSQSGVREVEAHATLDSNNGSRRHNGVVQGSAVRRLTPRECERLQGFPDDYTRIPYRNKPASECPDGPRYKALGNSMAVPCMAWIGQRIAAVEALSAMQEAA